VIVELLHVLGPVADGDGEVAAVDVVEGVLGAGLSVSPSDAELTDIQTFSKIQSISKSSTSYSPCQPMTLRYMVEISKDHTFKSTVWRDTTNTIISTSKQSPHQRTHTSEQ
jgi:hypothetical protein